MELELSYKMVRTFFREAPDLKTGKVILLNYSTVLISSGIPILLVINAYTRRFVYRDAIHTWIPIAYNARPKPDAFKVAPLTDKMPQPKSAAKALLAKRCAPLPVGYTWVAATHYNYVLCLLQSIHRHGIWAGARDFALVL